MKLNFIEKIKKEIVHFADEQVLIFSNYRTIYYQRLGRVQKITLPESFFKRFFGYFRLTRRALRLDKMNVFLSGEDLVIIRQGKVYLYKCGEGRLTQTLTLQNCRNVLHQSISRNKEGYIYFGEYGANKARTSVPVYCSRDGGSSWKVVYRFPPGTIKHVHGCYYDKFLDKIWVCTGDFQDENWLVEADSDFKNVTMHGDGQQKFRTCNLFFTSTEVHWLMDSQLEPSHHICMNRETQKIQVGQRLMGPVWYSKELTDGFYLAATAQEVGPGVLDKKAHLYCSTDLRKWDEIATFEHDGFPKRYFKFGVPGFSDGIQSSNCFYMFFEAIKGFDGAIAKCSIDK